MIQLAMDFHILNLYILVLIIIVNYNQVALILTLLVHTEFTLFEISWSFSIWLEAIAIIP